MIFNMTGGGSNPLNFKVVGGTTEPSNPAENTIWVNTSTTISSWVFSATQPSSPSSGMVWILTDDSGDAKFNALKKNGITLYPTAAKQYASGKFTDVPATIYKNGQWIPWIYVIQKLSSAYWKANGTTNRANVTNVSNGIKITFTQVAAWNDVGGYVDESVNLTNYKTVVFSGTHNGVAETVQLCIYNKSGAVVASRSLPVGTETKPTTTNLESYPIDCSAIKEECYFGIAAKVGTFVGSITINSIKIK